MDRRTRGGAAIKVVVRLVAAVAVTTAALLGGVPAASAAPGDSGEVVFVATHNIQHTAWGGLRYVAEHDRPLMMMGQEVCSTAL
ncbi:MAG TPA: hypothetical protein VK507_15875 [Iamia sp.]|nr:hypothetical protein [Iamia sp.]